MKGFLTCERMSFSELMCSTCLSRTTSTFFSTFMA